MYHSHTTPQAQTSEHSAIYASVNSNSVPGSGISPAIKNKEINLFLLGTAENLKRPTCPGRGAFAGLFWKYPYDRGSAGGALGEGKGSVLELTDAAYKLKVYCTTYMYKLNLKWPWT